MNFIVCFVNNQNSQNAAEVVFMLPRKLFCCYFFAFFNLSGCSKSIDDAVWREEVLLHSGELLLIDRQAKAYANGFPNSSRGGDIKFSINYKPHNISWRGEAIGNPLSFEVFDGEVYLTFSARSGSYCKEKEPDQYAALFLKHTSTGWREVSQFEVPVDVALVNLYQRYWGGTRGEDATGLVSWSTKALNDGFDSSKPVTLKEFFERRGLYCKFFQKN